MKRWINKFEKNKEWKLRIGIGMRREIEFGSFVLSLFLVLLTTPLRNV